MPNMEILFAFQLARIGMAEKNPTSLLVHGNKQAANQTHTKYWKLEVVIAGGCQFFNIYNSNTLHTAAQSSTALVYGTDIAQKRE
jgi:hypothetical protein